MMLLRRLCLLLCLSTTAFAAPTQEWFALKLGDQRIGYIERSREVRDGVVESREYFRARLNRNGVPLTITTEENHRESADGRPLGFSFRQKLGESELRMSGTLLDGDQVRVRVRQGKASTQRHITWPEGALLMEGVRLRERALRDHPGQRLSYRMFNPASLEGVDTEARMAARESLRIGEHEFDAYRIEHLLAIAQSPVRVISHVDADGELLRTTLPLFGRELLIERADARVVSLPQSRPDVYDFTLVAAPEALRQHWRDQNLRYRIEFARRDDGAGLPGDEQEWQPLGKGRFDLWVTPTRLRVAQHAPLPADLSSTTWINTDDPAIRRHAERATAWARTPAQRMSALERSVRGRIDRKSLRVGYASASEAFAQREGDCTEHAVLLAAMARSLGIPARIVIGLVYAERFGHRGQVFVPHAWTQAWIDGRWQSYDAAQPGFGSDHIALAVGRGDPADYYASLERIGAMRIESVQPETP